MGKVVSVKQSPLNSLWWCLNLDCGHEEWVTAKKRPKKKTSVCAACRSQVEAEGKGSDRG